MKTTKEIKSYKVSSVSDIASKMSEAKSVVFVDYTGMTMKGQQALKAALKEVYANMMVAKNTYLRIAGESAKLPNELLTDTVLSGQTALVWGSADAVAPIQALGKFMKENELPKWKVGLIEGSMQTADGLEKISKLPSKEVLFAQVVGSIASPMYSLAGTLQGNLQKLVWMLQEKAAQG